MITRTVLTLVMSATTLSAQPPRDPNTARLVSILAPGAGHVYAGEPVRGLALLGGSAAAVTYAITQREKAVPRRCAGGFCTVPKSADNTSAYIGGAAFATLWLFAFADAGPAARRANTRVSVQPTPRGVVGRVTF